MLFSIRKIVVLFLLSFFFLSISANSSLAEECPKGWVAVKNEEGKTECHRPLEVVYPKIGGEQLTTTKELIKEGLPIYVKYIFNLAVGIIGLVIFGVLIYNGFLYLSSAGNPEKMSEAKKGILSSLLGGLILLSSVLIFDTINPQLKILKLEEISPLELVVMPGVYICTYNVNEAISNKQLIVDGKAVENETIGSILDTYLDAENQKTPKERIMAAKKLKAAMNINDEHLCYYVFKSTMLTPHIALTKKNTIFIVPSISIDREGKRLIEFKDGIVFFQNDNASGRCDYYPKEDRNNNIYHQIDDYSATNLSFTARSAVLFKKLPAEPRGEKKITLYSCRGFNQAEGCNDQFEILPQGDVTKVDLPTDLKENVRSIKFWAPHSFLAILKDNEQQCDGFYDSHSDIVSISRLRMCPTGCKIPIIGWLVEQARGKDCSPCVSSTIIIKGKLII